MKYFAIFLILMGFAGFTIPNVSALCAAEAMEWWEACNDTGPNNALPLNPMLLLIIFIIVILATVIGVILFWRKRK